MTTQDLLARQQEKLKQLVAETEKAQSKMYAAERRIKDTEKELKSLEGDYELLCIEVRKKVEAVNELEEIIEALGGPESGATKLDKLAAGLK